MSNELWRIALKARLNLCPVVGRRYQGQRASIFKRCNEAGTLFHIISSCKKFFMMMTLRHSTILFRLARTCFQGQYLCQLDSVRIESLLASGSKSIILKPGITLLLESRVPKSQSLLKPDLVLFNEVLHIIHIVDVTIVAEASSKAFDSARAHKLFHYRKYEAELWTRGYLVKVDAFIVGALGAWDPNNARVLQELRCPHASWNELMRYCSVEALRGSHNIYLKYLEGVQEGGDPTCHQRPLDSLACLSLSHSVPSLPMCDPSSYSADPLHTISAFSFSVLALPQVSAAEPDAHVPDGVLHSQPKSRLFDCL